MEILTFISFGSYEVIVIRENALEFAYSLAIADGERMLGALFDIKCLRGNVQGLDHIRNVFAGIIPLDLRPHLETFNILKRSKKLNKRLTALDWSSSSFSALISLILATQ